MVFDSPEPSSGWKTQLLCMMIYGKLSFLRKSRGGRCPKGRSRQCGVGKGIRKHGRRPESAETEVLQAKFQLLR